MITTSYDNQIIKYLPLLANEEKQSILSVIKSIIKLKETSSLHISIEQYNQELAEAETRINAGFYTTIDDAIKQAETW